jgi:hypothetical protein
MLNFFKPKKQPSPFDQGYDHCEQGIDYWMKRGKTLIQAVALLQEALKCNPPADRYRRGYEACLECVIQVVMAQTEQIPAETPNDLACDLLEFLEDDLVVEPYDNGFRLAEEHFHKLLQEMEDAKAVHAYMVLHRQRLKRGMSTEERFGFHAFLARVADNLERREALETQWMHGRKNA